MTTPIQTRQHSHSLRQWRPRASPRISGAAGNPQAKFVAADASAPPATTAKGPRAVVRMLATAGTFSPAFQIADADRALAGRRSHRAQGTPRRQAAERRPHETTALYGGNRTATARALARRTERRTARCRSSGSRSTEPRLCAIETSSERHRATAALAPIDGFMRSVDYSFGEAHESARCGRARRRHGARGR